MAEPTAPRDILARVMSDGRKVLVPHLAEMLKREAITEVDSSEERRRFWARAQTPEQEQGLWQAEMAARGLTELTPEHAVDIGLGISKQVYPDRWDMASAEGRTTESEIAEWAAGHARKGPPPEKQEEQP